jgi:hypothetical protein
MDTKDIIYDIFDAHTLITIHQLKHSFNHLKHRGEIFSHSIEAEEHESVTKSQCFILFNAYLTYIFSKSYCAFNVCLSDIAIVFHDY